MSKLAALAAKRRQKEAAAVESASQKASDSLPDEYAASLSKLSLGNEKLPNRKESASATENEASASAGDAGDQIDASAAELPPTEDEPIVTRTAPSAFAGTFLTSTPATTNFAINPVGIVDKPSFSFNDPSPDDIVFKAQTGRSR